MHEYPLVPVARQTTPTARVPHTCSICLGPIDMGEVYRRTFLVELWTVANGRVVRRVVDTCDHWHCEPL